MAIATSSREVISAHAEQVGIRAVEWLRSNRPDARLVLLEGAMQSGKSRAVGVIRVFWQAPMQVVELDELIPKGSLGPDESWLEAVLRSGAEHAIREAMQGEGLALVEGPAAWPVIERLSLTGTPGLVRIYIKRVEERASGRVWTGPEDNDALRFMPRNPALQALDDYHFHQRPDLDADLVIERTGQDD